MWFVHLLYFSHYTLYCGIEFRGESERFIEVKHIDRLTPVGELVVGELMRLQALHFKHPIGVPLIQLDIIGLLIHQLKNNLILFFVLLVQRFNSDLRQA